MPWGDTTITPRRDQPPKVRIDYPCPGLIRFAGMVSCVIVSIGVYSGVGTALGIADLHVPGGRWTAGRVVLAVASGVLGLIATLIGAGFAMTIEVRSEKWSNFFITLWQFFANTALLWLMLIGTAMSVSLGRVQAKATVVAFGPWRAALHLAATSAALGLILGIAYYVAATFKLYTPYFVWSVVMSLVAARLHYLAYGIAGSAWIGAGLVLPFALLFFAPAMIERDVRERRLMMENRDRT